MALCISSWKKVQAIDNYKDVAGELLFRNYVRTSDALIYLVFEIAPDAANLFKFGENGITDETYKQEAFLKHARGVIGTVDKAVDLLEKGEMEALATALKTLGAKHATYDVKFEHFPIVGTALLDTLEKALGDEFTPEVREAWAGVYGVITEHMTDGMKEVSA